MRKWVGWTLALGIATLGGGCETAVAICAPGTFSACDCPTGFTGAQLCSDDGTELGTCTCLPASDGGVGFDAGSGAGTDAGPGGGTDAGPGGGPDAGPSPGDDGGSTGTDAGPGGGTDAGPGGGTDAGPGGGTDAGPGGGTDAGDTCTPIVVPAPGVACSRTTLFCLSGCSTGPGADACINGCLGADPDPAGCGNCLTQGVFACGTMNGCAEVYGCLDACVDANCTPDGPCIVPPGPCASAYDDYGVCHDAMTSTGTCAPFTLGCFPAG